MNRRPTPEGDQINPARMETLETKTSWSKFLAEPHSLEGVENPERRILEIENEMAEKANREVEWGQGSVALLQWVMNINRTEGIRWECKQESRKTDENMRVYPVYRIRLREKARAEKLLAATTDGGTAVTQQPNRSLEEPPQQLSAEETQPARAASQAPETQILGLGDYIRLGGEGAMFGIKLQRMLNEAGLGQLLLNFEIDQSDRQAIDAQLRPGESVTFPQARGYYIAKYRAELEKTIQTLIAKKDVLADYVTVTIDFSENATLRKEKSVLIIPGRTALRQTDLERLLSPVQREARDSGEQTNYILEAGKGALARARINMRFTAEGLPQLQWNFDTSSYPAARADFPSLSQEQYNAATIAQHADTLNKNTGVLERGRNSIAQYNSVQFDFNPGVRVHAEGATLVIPATREINSAELQALVPNPPPEARRISSAELLTGWQGRLNTIHPNLNFEITTNTGKADEQFLNQNRNTIDAAITTLEDYGDRLGHVRNITFTTASPRVQINARTPEHIIIPLPLDAAAEAALNQRLPQNPEFQRLQTYALTTAKSLQRKRILNAEAFSQLANQDYRPVLEQLRAAQTEQTLVTELVDIIARMSSKAQRIKQEVFGS